ncbi:unnamed protein product [Moneuplotes crassus]|uniref:Chromo domain-containing protein n=1 Tax=Euplotes crassus TaxID=5936 RepID=A0AAD1UEK7_EUPCR|nr:unnamed protein product [Moneuplotes crassus]
MSKTNPSSKATISSWFSKSKEELISESRLPQKRRFSRFKKYKKFPNNFKLQKKSPEIKHSEASPDEKENIYINKQKPVKKQVNFWSAPQIKKQSSEKENRVEFKLREQPNPVKKKRLRKLSEKQLDNAIDIPESKLASLKGIPTRGRLKKIQKLTALQKFKNDREEYEDMGRNNRLSILTTSKQQTHKLEDIESSESDQEQQNKAANSSSGNKRRINSSDSSQNSQSSQESQVEDSSQDDSGSDGNSTQEEDSTETRGNSQSPERLLSEVVEKSENNSQDCGKSDASDTEIKDDNSNEEDTTVYSEDIRPEHVSEQGDKEGTPGEFYEVGAICGRKSENKLVYYLVKWKGLKETENCWVYYKYLIPYKSILQSFGTCYRRCKKNVIEQLSPQDKSQILSYQMTEIKEKAHKKALEVSIVTTQKLIEKIKQQKGFNYYFRDKTSYCFRKLSRFPKEGRFECNDKPKKIISALQSPDPSASIQLAFKIEWHVRENGFKPLPSLYKGSEVKNYNTDILIDFYESKLKLS